jgi:hypothetical protein
MPEDVDLLGRRAAERYVRHRKEERRRREDAERVRAASGQRRERVAPKTPSRLAPEPDDGGPQDDWEPPRGGR